MFSHSPKARQIRAEQALTGAPRVVSSVSPPARPIARQTSIVTLSSRTTPDNNVAAQENRHLITSNTRQIAALAARRKAHYDTVNQQLSEAGALNKTYTSLMTDGSVLTQSRLEQHNQHFDSPDILDVVQTRGRQQERRVVGKPNNKRIKNQEYAGYQQVSLGTSR